MSTFTMDNLHSKNLHPVQSKIKTTVRERRSEPDSKTSAPRILLCNTNTITATASHVEVGTYNLVVSPLIHSRFLPEHLAWYPCQLPLLRLSWQVGMTRRSLAAGVAFCTS